MAELTNLETKLGEVIGLAMAGKNPWGKPSGGSAGGGDDGSGDPEPEADKPGKSGGPKNPWLPPGASPTNAGRRSAMRRPSSPVGRTASVTRNRAKTATNS